MKLIVDNVWTKIEGATETDINAIYRALSFQVKDYKMVARRMSKHNPRMRNWDGIKSFLDRKNKRFLSGFIPRVQAYLNSQGLRYEIMNMNSGGLAPILSTSIPSLEGIELRDYQQKSVLDFFASKRGVAKLCTGAGKTEIAIAITAKASVPTIFLTHRVNLLNQTAKRFEKRLPHLKGKIGIIGAGQFNPGVVTIATVQTLHSIIKKDPKVAAEILGQYKLMIIDEAHRSGSRQFYETACFCKNASLRLALTATPFMKGNDEDDMWLEGITGNVISDVSAGELIDRGILAKPFFRFIPVDTPLERKYTDWRDIYEFGIVRNIARNKIIVAQALKTVEMGKKTLVIVQELNHGRILEDVMKSMSMRAQYVDGSNTAEERERALRMLAKDKLDIIICTNIFDEGIDVGEIGAVILAAGCKSAPALFQRTGRAVRAKEEGNNFAVIIDLWDNHHPKLLEHSQKRFDLVSKERGFVII